MYKYIIIFTYTSYFIELGNSFPKLTNRKKYIPTTINLYVNKNNENYYNFNNNYNNDYLISDMLINQNNKTDNIILASDRYIRNSAKKYSRIIYPNYKRTNINSNKEIYVEPCFSISNVITKYPYI